MTRFLVELSEENLPLARAEASAAAEALGGAGLPATADDPPAACAVELSGTEAARSLSGRLALSRRVLLPWAEPDPERRLARLAAVSGAARSAAFRPWGHLRGNPDDPLIGRLARAWGSGRGVIDLDRPDFRFQYREGPSGSCQLYEEVGAVDRRSYDARRMPRLPFQRPVSLAPRLARAAANLARIRPGDRVVDPFVGTGALLVEAGLLGARLVGVDRDPEMVKGAIRNLAHFHLEAEELVVADAAEALGRLDGPFDAVLTDPPYGRASGSLGEPPSELVARVLPGFAGRLSEGGRMCAILPGGADPVGPPFERVVSVADRVHRSLTREFRVYQRPAGPR